MIYHDLKTRKASLGVVMMLKNEEKRISVTLESIKNVADAIIVYDTGCDDNTINLIEEFSVLHKINLYVTKGLFVDFSTSRNVLLDFADTVDVDFLLLLDCNDELRGEKELLKFLKESYSINNNGFLVCQVWWSGKFDKYFNVRLIKNKCGWRYRGVVHEWIKDTTVDTHSPKYPLIKIPDCITLFQDRTKDGNKSFQRFTRDRELLLQEHLKNPTEPRTLFYLGQTCECLGLAEESYRYSRLRAELDGFEEERFHSFMRCGNLSKELKYDWSISLSWFMKAYEHSERAEPLIKITEYYKDKNNWKTAYLFCDKACDLEYPHDSILFIDNTIYEYLRWHYMSIIAYYVQEYDKGKYACLKSLEKSNIKDTEKKNLTFYTDKENEMKTEFNSLDYIKKEIKKLRMRCVGKISLNKVQTILKEMWKR